MNRNEKTMQSRFRSTCRACGKAVRPGDGIRWAPDHPVLGRGVVACSGCCPGLHPGLVSAGEVRPMSRRRVLRWGGSGELVTVAVGGGGPSDRPAPKLSVMEGGRA